MKKRTLSDQVLSFFGVRQPWGEQAFASNSWDCPVTVASQRATAGLSFSR